MRFGFIPFFLLVIPIAEIATFITLGGQIGIMPTLLMILVTAIIGSFLLRHQGLSILKNAQSTFNQGGIPGKAIGESLMIIVAGILLLTPGFITDTIGFLLFIPALRSKIWNLLTKNMTISPLNSTPYEQSPGFDKQFNSKKDETVIDLDADDYKTQSGSSRSPWNTINSLD